ncbi:MAG: hypothetical protein JXR68_09450 [Bacteroidales bacterium]|nr:hypothetical protein [Bacteroidales bacterium]
MKYINEFLYFSVGFAAKTTDKLTKIVQKLIEQNEMSETEGKIIVEEYAKNVREQIAKFDKKLEDFIACTMNSCAFASKTDIDTLKKRIEKIESSI